MKKRFFAIAVCAALLAGLFAGCACAENLGGADDANAAAERAYMDFLSGKTTLTTSEKFRADDSEFNMDGLLYGTYDYAALKSAIAALEAHASRAQYALLDLTRDGVNELVLRLENIDPSFMNWVGIVKYHDGELLLTDYYEDGYRTFSTLYESGYLLIGGAMSAGAHLSTLVAFDENGCGVDVFTEKQHYGTFATGIAYDLPEGENGLADNYDDIAGTSLFLVREYVAGDAVKLSVRDWNETPAIRKREEALIDALVKLGAELISEEEMDGLCSLAPYEAEEARWQAWDDAVLHADYAAEELLAQPEAFYAFTADESEYQVQIAFSTSAAITDVRVLSLNMEAVNDAGEMTFGASELYFLPALTPEKPLVVGMAFAGEIPNMGVSYVADGQEHVYAISLSGLDGTPLLTEANLSRQSERP